MKQKALFIGATGQNVGKTTISLGLVSGLKKRYKQIGFMKPVGQEHVEVDGIRVDKDVRLFHNHFNLKDPWTSMSPVLIPKGFTKDYLDGKIKNEEMKSKILEGYKVLSKNPFTLIEGTGHIGVGSIVDMNNADVASLLGVNMVLVLSGGLGSSFDEFCLNKLQCDQRGVKISGVIINRVLPDKKEMIANYMQKALGRWDIPILGLVPYNDFLSKPSMEDFEELFKTELITGTKHRLRHFKKMRLVATSVDTYRSLIAKEQLIITPASREDVILATLSAHLDHEIRKDNLGSGFILTGSKPPRKSIIRKIEEAEVPMLYAPLSSYNVMKMITSYIAKIHDTDIEKVEKAINVVESHIDFNTLCNLL